MYRIAVIGLLVCAGFSCLPSARAQQSAQVTPLSPEGLYEGWRASRVLDSKVVSKAEQNLGTVRNLVLGHDGQIKALVVEGPASNEQPEFVYRIPWEKIAASPLPRRIVADVANRSRPEYGIFPGKAEVGARSNEFAITEVLGDYARLQAGQGYGYVSDVVFGQDGRMLAVLVAREAAGGGGTYAFGFPGSIGRWDPRMSYYGLPYVTPEQANKAAVRVDPRRFPSPGAG